MTTPRDECERAFREKAGKAWVKVASAVEYRMCLDFFRAGYRAGLEKADKLKRIAREFMEDRDRLGGGDSLSDELATAIRRVDPPKVTEK